MPNKVFFQQQQAFLVLKTFLMKLEVLPNTKHDALMHRIINEMQVDLQTLIRFMEKY